MQKGTRTRRSPKTFLATDRELVMPCSDVETYTAKKEHRCSWCGQTIQTNTQYKKYRWWEGSEAGTCKMHPECYEAMLDVVEGGIYFFEAGDNPKGCNCGHSAHCPKCHPKKEESHAH
jgi:hypothetical protein